MTRPFSAARRLLPVPVRRALKGGLDSIATALIRRGFGERPPPPPQAVPPDIPPPQAAPPDIPPDILDTYHRESPNMQAAVDIFRGIWSSRFPPQYAVRAGDADLFHDPRLQWLLERLGGVDGYRILELGPLEGAHSYFLERAGAASVLAIEACTISYLKCLMVKDLTRLERVTFQFGNFMPFLTDSTETFDLLVASGVLYHQRDPLLCIKRMAARSGKVFIWTHCYDDNINSDRINSRMFSKVPGVTLDGFECDLYRLEYDAYLKHVKYRGGVDDYTHWMRKDDLLACLKHFGLGQIQIAFDTAEHPYGPNLALLAERVPSGT